MLPGDQVAVSEEFVAGRGTYEQEGKIYASYPGIVDLNENEKVARVKGFNPPVQVERGEVIFARVTDIKSSLLICEIFKVEGKERKVVGGEVEGTLHVSKMSEQYTEDIRDHYRVGDILRGRVLQTEPSIQLTTADKRFGVALGLCTQCRKPMELRGRELFCVQDDRAERRKIVVDYGNLEL